MTFLLAACSSTSGGSGDSGATTTHPDGGRHDTGSTKADASRSTEGGHAKPDARTALDAPSSVDAPSGEAGTNDARSDAGSSGDANRTDAAGQGADDTGSYVPAGYHLVWEDLFDTGSTPSTMTWSMYYSPGNGGNGLRRPSAFSVHDGELDILAEDQDGGIVSGGMAATHSETHAYYEFRVRTDADPSQATDGVVLTWPDDGVWPQHGEEDIYETGTSATRDPFNTYIHYGNVGSTQYIIAEPADAKQWHVMGMEWTATIINIYRDGTFVGKVTDPNAIPTVSHHLSVQLDAYTGSVAAPTHMYVDWVKVFQM